MTLTALTALASCTKEPADPVAPASGPAGYVTEELILTRGYEQGIIVVQLDEDLAATVQESIDAGKVMTKSMAVNSLADEFGITGFTRVFPDEDAPEYVERSHRDGMHRWFYVEYDESAALSTRASSDFASVPGVLVAEARPRRYAAAFNDPYLGRQWHYVRQNAGQVDINVSTVWSSYTVGSPSVIVAVADGGVDLSHEDLAANCLAEGHFNFATNTSKIDPMAHGSHVAGTVAAVNNNGIGVCGVAGGDAAAGKAGARIMSCQFFGITSNGSSARAVKWGADHGAVISQNSWGYVADLNDDGVISPSERDYFLNLSIGADDRAAVDYFIKNAGCDNSGRQKPDSPMKGGLVVFAAGNENLPAGPPASYEKILAVGACSSGGYKASFSNYGDWVDICAPGESIFSTVPGDSYDYMNGTSMACPHVSGVAALVVAYCGGQGFTADMLRTKLVNGANASIPGNNHIGPLLDAMGAITYGSDATPGEIRSFRAEGNSNNIDVTWNVTAASDGRSTYGAYIYASKSREALENLDLKYPSREVVSASVLTSTCRVGEEVTGRVSGLDFDGTYYVTIAPYSYTMQYGGPAPIAEVRTGRNNPPVIEVLSLTEGNVFKSFQKASLPVKVYDPDGHEVTTEYRQGGPADSFGYSSLDGSPVINIDSPLADAGTYKASVTATDRYGAVTVYDLVYTVAENNAPVLKGSAPDRILSLDSGNDSFKLNVSGIFEDPDGEPLAIRTSVNDGRLVHVSRNGDDLYVTALSYGMAVITLTAEDARKASVSTEMRVLVRRAGEVANEYPNPVTTDLYIATGETEETTDVTITGQTGAVVHKARYRGSAFNPVHIDMRGVAPGKYKLVFTVGGREIEKIIVKK